MVNDAPVAAPAVLVLPRESLSGNTLAYAHWRARMKDRDAWIVLVRAAMARSPVRLPPPTGLRRVHLQAIRKRTLDRDNLSAGLKHAVDSLVRCGLLLDDSDRLARITYGQERCRGRRPLVLVTVWPEGA